ncbi:hypothetical protein [Blastococcus sp. CCUG 61487]|uniref:hypothetical protein n=1 Tax=Blastococcus sp. CCUG 61487 TaxID=1840703 RepID=UPI0010BF948E|nr:hypothetical protein [Blastococcus sp. CCUG 61487]TKJ24366.1 hypothetical protein A6V29_05045 [Blastococcus sp. CCUG 61487]
MTSLRDRIEAKARRTATIPLQVGDIAAAAAEVATARAALDLHLGRVKGRTEAEGGPQTDDEQKRTIVLRGALKEALAREAGCVVDVELQALPDDEWDAILGQAPEDEAGDIDLDDVRAALLAASCIDETLRDEQWWTEQLARPEYSKGDKVLINNTLLRLNLNTPDGRQGKG